ncbi:IQ-DOMAIN 14-like [Orobanche hederae]
MSGEHGEEGQLVFNNQKGFYSQLKGETNQWLSDRQGSNKKSIKEKKKSKWLIPLFRQPSSIEKILDEADQLFIRPTITTSSSQRPKSPPVSPISPSVASPRAAEASHLEASTFFPKPAAPKVAESRKENRPEPTLRNQHLSAIKIQAGFRGYQARRSFRALRGLVRLQQVVRGQNVKRQTANAMKQMQLLVRVQTQVQSRRIQMLENQALQQGQSYNRNHNKELDSTLSKWTNQPSEAGQNEDWDDSLLTKEEEERRLCKKMEAIIKRERAMAYAYSNQLWKANPKSDHSPMDLKSNAFPWWWNWLERQLPEVGGTSQSISLTSPRPDSESKPSPRFHNNKHTGFASDNHDSPTPIRVRQTWTPPANNKYSKTRASAANSSTTFDADSLMSCPPFSIPNYMTPTISAKSKMRANSNPRERFPRTPGNESNRRFSFPLTPKSIASSFKGGSNKDSTSQTGQEKHESPRSIGGFAVNSADSMPALVGRKPFNRFV